MWVLTEFRTLVNLDRRSMVLARREDDGFVVVAKDTPGCPDGEVGLAKELPPRGPDGFAAAQQIISGLYEALRQGLDAVRIEKRGVFTGPQ